MDREQSIRHEGSLLMQGIAQHLTPQQQGVLSAIRVGIIGAGGLGSNVALMLVRSGFRRFTLADPDRVEASNLNRQAYWPEDVGSLKVEALARRLHALDQGLDIRLHSARVSPANAACLFAGCDAVVEAVDDAATKASLYRVFSRSAEIYVTASGMAGYSLSLDMTMTRPRPNVVMVGDFTSEVNDRAPALAPRVMLAAALEAGAVLEYYLETCNPPGSAS